jgi:hypothetical protein
MVLPYLKAVKLWNANKSVLKQKAYVLPFGPTKTSDLQLYNQVKKIQQEGKVSSSIHGPMPALAPAQPVAKPPRLRPIQLRKQRHHIKYVRQGHSGKTMFNYQYTFKNVPSELQLESPQIDFGSGTYATVVAGTWKGKHVAVKFQILDAPIPQPFPQRQCGKKGEPDCGYMSTSEWDKELKNIETAGKVNLGPTVYFDGIVDVDSIKVTPNIPKDQQLRPPSKMGLIVMQKLDGIPLYNYLMTNKVTKTEVKNWKDVLLKQFLDLFNLSRQVWTDLHFGNILIDTKTKQVIPIDIGALSQPMNKATTDEIKKYYIRILDKEFQVARY